MKAQGAIAVIVSVLFYWGCSDDCPSGQYDSEGNCTSFTTSGSQSDGSPERPSDENEYQNQDQTPPGECDRLDNCPQMAADIGAAMQEVREEKGDCGADSLQWDPRFAATAQACTVDMANSEDSTVCTGTLGARLAAEGFYERPFQVEFYLAGATADDVVSFFSAQPNLTYYFKTCDFDRVAVAVTRGPHGWYWVCLVFAAGAE